MDKLTLKLNQAARADFLCSCGRRHDTDIKDIYIGPATAAELASLALGLGRVGAGRVLLVADANTWAAAGKKLKTSLASQGILTGELVFPAHPVLVADERAVFSILNGADRQTCLLVAVGSGTINDLVRYVSYKLALPYAIYATAPSMDGYASSVAALTVADMKQTMPAWGAEAILADPAVLAASPAPMIAAGLGDILGKFTAVADWRLGQLVEDEYYCPEVAADILATARNCQELAGQLKERDQAAVSQIFAALLETGIAMSYVGSSRPASGSEHHLSHFWEMAYLREGKEPLLHGTKVGLATLLMAALYQDLAGKKPDFDLARQRAAEFSLADWSRQMELVYGQGADVIIGLEKASKTQDPVRVLRNIDRLEASWPAVGQIARLVPGWQEIGQALAAVRGATRPDQMGLTRQLVRDSLLYARHIRQRYTVLQLYADLGLAKEAADLLEQIFCD